MALKFSLIIATLNAGKRLEKALSSIFGQTWPEYEVIVQDGGSADNTLDLPARYAGRLSLRSEPDCGIYDAWNRAVERASGDWGLFLGADDRLLGTDVLARCARHLETLPEGIVFAYGDLLEGNGFWRRLLIRRSLRTVYTMMTDTIGLPFPSTFTRMSALRTHRFDTSFRIAGDHEFTARLVTADNVARLP
ncbi:MAG: glycosyltransferase, partial [Desulfovibrio sp.]|nr:glycosyltransferase [Desulfovibrio sp.]